MLLLVAAAFQLVGSAAGAVAVAAAEAELVGFAVIVEVGIGVGSESVIVVPLLGLGLVVADVVERRQSEHVAYFVIAADSFVVGPDYYYPPVVHSVVAALPYVEP